MDQQTWFEGVRRDVTGGWVEITKEELHRGEKFRKLQLEVRDM